MLVVLVALVHAECYFNDALFNMGNKPDGTGERQRYEAAADVCRALSAGEPESITNWLSQSEFNLTNTSLVFYTSKESPSMDLDLDLALKRAPMQSYGKKVIIYVGGEASLSLSVKSSRDTSFQDADDEISLVALEAVTEISITNSAAGKAGQLFLQRFEAKNSACVIKAEGAVPSIDTIQVYVSARMIQLAHEGQIRLNTNYYGVRIDENLQSGQISGLVPGSIKETFGSTTDEDGWKTENIQITQTTHVIVAITKPVKVTFGKLSVTLESGDKVLDLQFDSQSTYVWFDVQADVFVDLYCKDNVNPDELIGGALGYERFPYYFPEITVPSNINAYRFHGENWPIAWHLNEIETVLKTETLADTENKVITKTKYVEYRRSLLGLDDRDGGFANVYFNITGRNLPVAGYSKTVFTLAGPDVGIQGPLRSGLTIAKCGAEKCILRVAYVDDEYGPINVQTTGKGDLTVIAQTCDHPINLTENLFTLLCDTIDATTNKYDDLSGMTLAENGVVNVLYTYPSQYPSLSEVWDTSEHLWFQSGNTSEALWEDWTYALDFLNKNKKALNPAALKDMANHLLRPLEGVKVTGKSRIFVSRKDRAPFAPLYSKNDMKVVCLESGEISPKDWSIEFNSTLDQLSNGHDMFGDYGPLFSEFGVSSSSLVQMTDKSCLAAKVEQPPNSAAITIVYTSNTTYIDILSEFKDFVTVVTPQTVDSQVTLSNPRCKNVVVLFLDSIPDGKSVLLNNIRNDGNVVVLGIPFAALDNVFKIVSLACANETIDDAYYAELQELIKPLVNEYEKYFPKVSITTNHISSVFLAGANYVGTKIDADNFYAMGCKFTAGLSVSASYTATDTFSYDSLKNIVLENLVIFPVSTDPVDHLSVSTVEFTSDKITLKGNKGHFGFAGSVTKDVVTDIQTGKVTGALHILSFTDSLSLSIPAGAKVTKVKGIAAVMGADIDNFRIYDLLPSVPLLSDEEPVSELVSQLGLFFKQHFQPRLLAANKEVAFTGDWEQVKEIEGTFSIDTAADPVSLKEVPVNVIQKLQVKSSASAEINVPGNVDTVHMGPQIVKGSSQMSFGSQITVTFENLTFAAGTEGQTQISSFSLSINKVDSELQANHIKCGEYSRVSLNSVSIRDSLEMGRKSTLTVSKLAATEFDVKLHYTLEHGFPTFPVPTGVTPRSVKLYYDGDDEGIDIESYKLKPITIRRLNSAEQCNAWQSKVSYESEYADFSGKKGRVAASCNGAELVLTYGVTPGDDLPIGAIVGGVIGGLAVIAIVVVIVVIVLMKRKKAKLESHESSDQDTTL